MTRIARPLLPATFAVSILLAACSAGSGSGSGSIVHPGGNDLVLRVEYRGGFVPAAYHFTSFPSFTLTGDGRVIVPGAQIAIYPGPALPAVMVRTLTEEGIQAVLQEVARSGPLASSAEFRGAESFVADASDTVFTLHADGRDVEVVVYALGTFDLAGEHPGISATEIASHLALSGLNDKLMDLEGWLPASAWADASWSEFQPEALRLLVRNADSDVPDDSGIDSQLLDWPDASDPAAFGDATFMDGLRCGVVSGQDAKDWLAALSGANQLTRFTSGDHRYEVTVRFLLPDEPLECPPQAV